METVFFRFLLYKRVGGINQNRFTYDNIFCSCNFSAAKLHIISSCFFALKQKCERPFF